MSFFPWQCQKKIKYSILDIFHHICAYTSTVCFFYFPAMIICLVGYQGKRRGSVIWLLHHDMAVYMTSTWYTYANQKLGDGTHPGVSHLHKLPRVSTFPGDQVLGNPFWKKKVLGKSSAQCTIKKKINPMHGAFRSVWPPLHMHVMTATSLITEPTCQEQHAFFSLQGCISTTCPSRDQLELDASLFLPFPKITIKTKALAPSHVVGAHHPLDLIRRY